MLDILAALLEMLSPDERQARARRGVGRRGADSTRRRPPAPPPPRRPREPETRAGRDGRQLPDDLIRQFFGIPAEEPAENAGGASPDIPPPPPRAAPQATIPVRKELRPPEPPEPRPAITGTLDAAYHAAAPDPDSGGGAARAAGPSGRELAERLREDAAAARTAFIYSEILGPPRADRLFDA